MNEMETDDNEGLKAFESTMSRISDSFSDSLDSTASSFLSASSPADAITRMRRSNSARSSLNETVPFVQSSVSSLNDLFSSLRRDGKKRRSSPSNQYETTKNSRYITTDKKNICNNRECSSPQTSPALIDITTPPRENSSHSSLELYSSQKRDTPHCGNLDDWINSSSMKKKLQETEKVNLWSYVTPDNSPTKISPSVLFDIAKNLCSPGPSKLRRYKENEIGSGRQNAIVISDSPPKFCAWLPADQKLELRKTEIRSSTCSPCRLPTETPGVTKCMQITSSTSQKVPLPFEDIRLGCEKCLGQMKDCIQKCPSCQKSICFRSSNTSTRSSLSAAHYREITIIKRSPLRDVHQQGNAVTFGNALGTVLGQESTMPLGSPLRNGQNQKTFENLLSPIFSQKNAMDAGSSPNTALCQGNTIVLGSPLSSLFGQQDTVSPKSRERHFKSSAQSSPRTLDLSTSIDVNKSPILDGHAHPKCSPFTEALRNSSVVSYQEKSQHTKDLEKIFLSPTFNRAYEPVKPVASRFDASGKVVRKKSDRELLHGFDCKCCAGYYDALDLNSKDRAKRVEQVSKHRGEVAAPCTPEHYWDVRMPDREERRRRAQIVETNSPCCLMPRLGHYKYPSAKRKLFF